ncbi:MAG: hypothetical protein MI866_17790, partial [Bacteroidales bacterium]|nr:hypothetical protein [Bacteroidales bacterium]
MNKFLRTLMLALLLVPISMYGQDREQIYRTISQGGLKALTDGEETTAKFTSKYFPGEKFRTTLEVTWRTGDLAELEITFPTGAIIENTTKLETKQGDYLIPSVSDNVVKWKVGGQYGLTVDNSPLEIEFDLTMPEDLSGEQNVTVIVGNVSNMGNIKETHEVLIKEAGETPELKIKSLNWQSTILKKGQQDASSEDFFRLTNGGYNDLEVTAITGLEAPFSLKGSLPTIKGGEVGVLTFNIDASVAGLFKQTLTIETTGGNETISLEAAIKDDTYTVELFEGGATQWPPIGWELDDFEKGGAWYDGNGFAGFDSYGDSQEDETAFTTPLIDISSGQNDFVAIGLSINNNKAENPNSYSFLEIAYSVDGVDWQGLKTIEAPNAGHAYIGLGHIEADRIQLRLKASVYQGDASLGYVLTPSFYNPQSVPESTNFQYPNDKKEDVGVAMELAWDRVQFATGYRLYYGTSEDALTMVELGDETRYVIEDQLKSLTSYFWKVVPFNDYGPAVDCPLWSFKTEDYQPTKWISNAEVNTRLTYGKDGEKALPLIRLAEDGSSYAVWLSLEDRQYRVRAQYLNAQGNEQWRRNGIIVSAHPQNSFITDYDAEIDADGNLLVTIADIRNHVEDRISDATIYKISKTGEFLWGPDGITLTKDETGDFVSPLIDLDSNGNTFVRIVNQSVDGAN